MRKIIVNICLVFCSFNLNANLYQHVDFLQLRELQRSLGDKFANDKYDEAILLANKLLSSNKKDPLVLVYKGSVEAMKAGDYSFIKFFAKKAQAEKSIETLDVGFSLRDNLAQNPADELELLIVYGVTNAHFPDIMKRKSQAKRALEEAINHKHFNGVPAMDKALSYSYLALLYKKDDIAKYNKYKSLAINEDKVIAKKILED